MIKINEMNRELLFVKEKQLIIINLEIKKNLEILLESLYHLHIKKILKSNSLFIIGFAQMVALS